MLLYVIPRVADYCLSEVCVVDGFGLVADVDEALVEL